jgi:hypothetical protein
MEVIKSAQTIRFKDLKPGYVFRGKKPKKNWLGEFDDREILYISPYKERIKNKKPEYSEEYKEWFKNKPYRGFDTLYSELTQIEFENETNKNAFVVEFDYTVQYNSSTVKDGQNYPTISMKKFIEWASHKI